MTLPVAHKYKYSKNSGESCMKNEEKTETYVCNICGKNFYRKASLTIHVNSHNFNNNNVEDGKGEREVQNTCNICFKKFTAKKNLLKHLRDVHKNFSEAERMVVKKIKCPEQNCGFLCRMMKELREHIEKCHKIKILKDTLEFPSEAVFQKWKKEEESNTVSWFVTGRKKTTLMDGTKKQTLYCHRTGHYNPKGFGKYRMRSVGSCKIGVTCPAAMEVIESPDGGVTVIYYKTHLGHMQDVVYLKLSSEERAHLAEKIKQGFSFDAILDDIKESRDVDNEKKKRIHLLSKKDLYSIMRTENCNRKSNRKESDNRIESRVRKTETAQESSSAMEGNAEDRMEECIHFEEYQNHVVATFKNDEFDDNQSTLEKQERDLNIPQTSKEGTSQFVILSPDIDYGSVAEIIFLSSSETNPGQQAIIAQNKLPHGEFAQKIKSQAQADENRSHKSNIHLQLKEKLEKISEFLPQSDYLTPKQFDLINAKLNGVLDIFNVANAKAKSRKQSPKKKSAKRNKALKSNGKTDVETEYKVQETIQLHENPFQFYAVFN